MKYEDTPTREFKGIWIPAEIWEDETLTVNEKILFLEIDSFTSANKSCFISNEHIAKLLHISENAASKVLNSLVKKGLVVVTKFDGRKRYIQSSAKQTRQKAKADKRKEQLRVGEKDTYYNQNTNTNTNEKDKSFSINGEKDTCIAAESPQSYNDVSNEEKFEEVWKNWCDYAKEQHKIKSFALKLQREKLLEYTNGNAEIAKIIIDKAILGIHNHFIPLNEKEESNKEEADTSNTQWE